MNLFYHNCILMYQIVNLCPSYLQNFLSDPCNLKSLSNQILVIPCPHKQFANAD